MTSFVHGCKKTKFLREMQKTFVKCRIFVCFNKSYDKTLLISLNKIFNGYLPKNICRSFGAKHVMCRRKPRPKRGARFVSNSSDIGV